MTTVTLTLTLNGAMNVGVGLTSYDEGIGTFGFGEVWEVVEANDRIVRLESNGLRHVDGGPLWIFNRSWYAVAGHHFHRYAAPSTYRLPPMDVLWRSANEGGGSILRIMK